MKHVSDEAWELEFGALGGRELFEKWLAERGLALRTRAEIEALEADARRYRYWRRFYSSRFVLVLPVPVSLRFDAARPMVEPAGVNYEDKVDAAIDAAIAQEQKS